MVSRVIDSRRIVRVQAWDVSASAPLAIGRTVGAVWPREVGAIASGVAEVLCVGPTEWLVIGREPDGDELCGRLGAALVGSPFRVTDVSQGLATVEFEGPEAEELLVKGCSLDLHAGRFPVGRCARTRFAGVPAVLNRRGLSRFEGIVAESYREYLLAWVADGSA